MITCDDILNLNFYKKEKFTGSYQGMRYLIKKDKLEIPAEANTDGTNTSETSLPTVSMDVFHVTIWPGPYNFASTPDTKKTCTTFPFTQEGKRQLVDWLNEQWRMHSEKWPAH